MSEENQIMSEKNINSLTLDYIENNNQDLKPISITMYTKNGVVHNIINSDIDPIYFSKNNKNSTTDLQNQIKQLKLTEEITKNQIKELEKSVKKQKKNLNK